jgi:hypothetical protein
MTNTVSLHKVWIARTAGLFILTALAVTYFAFPMLTMAKIVANPTFLPKGYKVDFMGEIVAPGTKDMSLSSGNGVVNLLRVTQFPVADAKKGAWLACNVTGPDNQAYPFTCTVDKVNTNDPTQLTVVFGQAGNTLMTSPAIVSAVQGHLANLTITTDAQKLNTFVPASLSSTGWGATATLPTTH